MESVEVLPAPEDILSSTILSLFGILSKLSKNVPEEEEECHFCFEFADTSFTAAVLKHGRTKQPSTPVMDQYAVLTAESLRRILFSLLSKKNEQ